MSQINLKSHTHAEWSWYLSHICPIHHSPRLYQNDGAASRWNESLNSLTEETINSPGRERSEERKNEKDENVQEERKIGKEQERNNKLNADFGDARIMNGQRKKFTMVIYHS